MLNHLYRAVYDLNYCTVAHLPSFLTSTVRSDGRHHIHLQNGEEVKYDVLCEPCFMKVTLSSASMQLSKQA